jgi:hypothetical protein
MYAGEVVERGPADACSPIRCIPTRAGSSNSQELDRPPDRLREVPGALPTAATRPLPA